MDVEQFRSRLRLLEDERAILGALHAYGHAIDYGDEEGGISISGRTTQHPTREGGFRAT